MAIDYVDTGLDVSTEIPRRRALRAMLRSRSRVAIAVVAWLLAVLVGTVRAEAPPNGYAEAVDQAVAAYNAGAFPEALAQFERAHARFPNARTAKGIGMTELELGHYRRSAEQLERALASTVLPLEGAGRSETQQLLAQARAREAIEQALAEYDAKNYEEASALFARAHELAPSARTLRGLGMATFELRRYAESIAQLEAALASAVKPLEGKLRGDTEALLARARGFVATVRVDLRPASAELSVDGELVAQPPAGLLLRIGEHVIEAKAAGYRLERRTLRVRGGETLRVDLKLQPDLFTAYAAGQPPPKREERRRVYKSPWLWTAVGALVVGGAVTGYLLATRDRGEERIVPETTPDTPPGFVLSTGGTR